MKELSEAEKPVILKKAEWRQLNVTPILLVCICTCYAGLIFLEIKRVC